MKELLLLGIFYCGCAPAPASSSSPEGLTQFYLGTEGGPSLTTTIGVCVCTDARRPVEILTCSWLMEMARRQRAASLRLLWLLATLQ